IYNAGCLPACDTTAYWNGFECVNLPEPPDPTDCPDGMRYNVATGECEVDYENLDFMIRCADQNGCHEQGCEPPHWWIYTNGSDFIPDCECPADHEPVKPTPSCCMAVDNQQKGGGYCISNSFNPYPDDTPVAPELSVQCWDKVGGGCAPGCEPSEFWEYNESSLPACLCGTKPPAPSCCVTDDSTGFCVSDEFNPYPDCWMDEQCLDDDLCSHSSCQNNRCNFEQISHGNLCEDGTENCVCLDGEPNWMELQRVCFDAGSSCEARSNGVCRSPNRWDYIEGENPPDCICDDGVELQPEPECCYVPDGKGGCYGPMENPYRFCWDRNQCNDNDACTMDNCGGEECIYVHIPNGQRCDSADDVCTCMNGEAYPLQVHNTGYDITGEAVPSQETPIMEFSFTTRAPETLNIHEINLDIYSSCSLMHGDNYGTVKLYLRDSNVENGWAMISTVLPTFNLSTDTMYMATLDIIHLFFLTPSDSQSSGVKEVRVTIDSSACRANDWISPQLIRVKAEGTASGLDIIFSPMITPMINGQTITF
ncbi:hypothetical protein HOB30_05095, partial [Candidatus Falkowbacteria bacterium]|nr:hypothetical protein [Candidatus Falkowbacteria bacterium]